MKVQHFTLLGAIAFSTLMPLAAVKGQFLTGNGREAQGYAIALEQGHAVAQSALDFALANADKSRSLAVGYDFSNIETDRTGTRLFKGDVDQHALHLNYSHAFAHFIAALQLSVFDAKMDSVFRDGAAFGNVEIDSKGWFLATTGAYQLEGFNFAAVAGLGRFSHDSTRRGVVATPKTADFDSQIYSLGLSTAYEIYQEGPLRITPRLGLDYTKVDVDAVNERITGPLLLDRGDLNSMDKEWVIGSAELLLGWMASEQLLFNAVLGWHYDFNNGNTTISGTDAVGGFGQVVIPDVGQSVFSVGLGADYAINDNWSAGLNGLYSSGDNLSAYTIGGMLTFEF